MACISTLSIKTGDMRHAVPCGQCAQCLKSKRSEWAFRLHQEWKYSESAKFITLTYEDEKLIYGDQEPTLYKPHIQQFIKSLRNRQIDETLDLNPHIKRNVKGRKRASKISTQLRYYALGEYGSETLRPHYHMLLFNAGPQTINKICDTWQHGNIQIDQVTNGRIGYITKYIINHFAVLPHNSVKPFTLMSNRPYIGHHYEIAKQYHIDTGNLTVRNENGQQVPLPRIYKEKFFTNKFILRNIQRENRKKADATKKATREHNIKLGNISEYDYGQTYDIQQTETQIRRIYKNAKKGAQI